MKSRYEHTKAAVKTGRCGAIKIQKARFVILVKIDVRPWGHALLAIHVDSKGEAQREVKSFVARKRFTVDDTSGYSHKPMAE